MSDIDRSEVIKYAKQKRHELIEFWEDYKHENREVKYYDFIINSLETDEAYNLMYEQPEFCANCIDRDYLIRDLYCKAHGETNINIHWLEGYIKKLPSVLPKAKEGHWIKEDRGRVEYSAVCSECGNSTFWSEKSNFCPNCGCRMIEPEESESDA